MLNWDKLFKNSESLLLDPDRILNADPDPATPTSADSDPKRWWRVYQSSPRSVDVQGASLFTSVAEPKIFLPAPNKFYNIPRQLAF
jgi:hypothetical protein